jgi:probable phosphoglycerate mutase
VRGAGPDDSAGTGLLLVRHGQSTWNAEGRWQGHADPPLSETGLRQARAAAPALAGFDAVWCSDLVRARQTAEGCGPPEVAVDEDPGLRERDVGSWTGLTRDEIEARWPGWIADGRRPDGWEDDAVVAGRAWAALRSIAATLGAGRRAVVVSHGGVIRAVETRLGVPPRLVPNLGGVWLHGASGGLVLGDRVTLIDAGPGVANTEPAVAAPE